MSESETLHGEKSPPSLEDFQDLLSSMTQDCDPDPPDIHHANEHSQVSVPEVVSTRAEERSPPSSSSCSEMSPDARSVQLQEEQHTFLLSWNDSDFTMPLEYSTPSIHRGSIQIS
jgi:hypothetical protein